MPAKQYNVFISYSHKDGESTAKLIAEKIEKDPGGAGITFWKDYDDMHYGQWNRQIEKAIDAVEFLVMVITPGALASPNCKDEWMYARKIGVCILPVNALPEDINFYKTFPKWLETQHIYNLEKNWNSFINNLNTRCSKEPIPYMAPRLSTIPGYVPRNEELSQIKSLLLQGKGNAGRVTITLEGSGGFGKTTLAIAICNDDDIINYFVDGIMWVTFGQNADTARDALHKLYRALSENERSFIDVEEAQQWLSGKMENKNCLIVIDDVWKPQDLKKVIDSLANCVVLVTTRFAHILPGQQVQPVRVNEMKTAESIALLTGKFESKVRERHAFESLAVRLGHWPLLLKLSAAEIIERVLEGESPEQALAFVQKKYDRRGITGFDLEDATQRDDSVKKSLDASIELLRTDEKEKLLQLGIFPDDEPVPYEIISLLWNVDDFETDDIIKKLYKYGLLDLDFINKTCSIHDVLLHYYKGQLSETKANGLYNSLAASLHDFKSFKNKYAWKWYVWHLIQAGRFETATHLLQSFGWIEARLSATDITELLKDYEHFLLDEDTDLIYRALKLSGSVLADDKNQLPAQIIGRLGYFKSPIIIQLIESAGNWTTKNIKWLKPLKPTLQPPGSLQKILKGHTNYLNGVLIHLNYAISWSWDNTLRLWNLIKNNVEVLVGHTSVVNGAKVFGNKIVSWSLDSTLRLWDIETCKCDIVFIGHLQNVQGALIYQDKIISWSFDKTIRIWDTGSGKTLHLLEGHLALINGALIYRDKVISWSDDNTARIWDIESGKNVNVLTGHAGPIVGLMIHQDKIISWSKDNMLHMWNIESADRLLVFEGHSGAVLGAVIYKDNLITWSKDKSIRIWDIESGVTIHVLNGHTESVRNLMIFQDKIISWSDDGTIRVWDIQAGRLLRFLNGHSDRCLEIIAQGNQIISGSLDRTLRVWDVESGNTLQVLKGPSPIVTVSSYQDKIITSPGSPWDFHIYVWDIHTNVDVDTLDEHSQHVYHILKHDDKIITWAEDKTLRIWNLLNGNLIHVLRGHTRSVYGAFTHQDKIISWSTDGTLRIWDIQSGDSLLELKEHTHSVLGALIHNSKLLSWSYDTTLRIWDFESGKNLCILKGHSAGVSGAIIYEDKIISWSDDTTLRIWEMESGRNLHVLEGHLEAVRDALIYRNAVISWSYDTTLRIWDIESGINLHVLKGHSHNVLNAMVYNDKIISTSFDGTIRIWDIENASCLYVLSVNSVVGIKDALVYEDKLISYSGDRIIIWGIDKGAVVREIINQFEISDIMVEDELLFVLDNSHRFIIYDINNFEMITCYNVDASLSTMEVHKEMQRIIAGDDSGKVHFLEPVGFYL